MESNVYVKVRKQFGLTQKVFAKLTGIGIASVLRYEVGKGQPATSQMTIYKLLKEEPSMMTTLWKINSASLTEEEKTKSAKKLRLRFPNLTIVE